MANTSGSSEAIAILIEVGASERVHVVDLVPGTVKIRGLGVLDPFEVIAPIPYGATVTIGQKVLRRVPARLPELLQGMNRRAQTISPKDAGAFIAKMGIGGKDQVLEAGLGSAALSLHILRCLGDGGRLVSMERREEHAEVGMTNIERLRASGGMLGSHHLVLGDAHHPPEAVREMGPYDAIILDLPEHAPAIHALGPHLDQGGRIGCYCPVTSQVESVIEAFEAAGLTLEWAGELIERPWGRASKGGMRPVNGPFGHTAFLVIGTRSAGDPDHLSA